MNFNSASPRMKKGVAGRGGTGRGRMKPSSGSGPQQNQGFEGLYANDRLVNAITSVLGCYAKVTAKSGKHFEGILKTISPEASLVLGKANQVEESRQNGIVKSENFEQFVINHKDWVKVEIKDVNLEECYCKKDCFKTDTAITGHKRMNGEKELERWSPGDSEETLEMAALESHRSMEVNGIGWSAEKMFELNEKKYGVKSTYNEDMEEYTTKLEKHDTPEYREKEKYAAQKAEEICKESSFERYTIDSGRSEEQLYSSVVRNRSSTPMNWRQPHNDRPPEREQQIPRASEESSGSPVPAAKDVLPARSQEPSTALVLEKIEKSMKEVSVECEPEPAFSDVVEADAKPVVHRVLPTNPPVSQELSAPQDSEPTVMTSKSRKDNIDEFKNFSVNFQLADRESKKKSKAKKVVEEEEKLANETTSKEETTEEQQASEDVKTEMESDKKAKSELNPNAQEFRPKVKRNTPSPRSNSTGPNSGAPSPFNNNSPFSTIPPYPPNNIYSRNGPRGRGGMRPEYVDSTTGYVNASNAAGQPFFAPLPHPFMQPSPPGVPYMQHGGLRHPGLQPSVFIQQHHQGPMMVPVGQMGPGPYQDNTIYYGPMPVIQSPPQITSPSLQQPHFNFPNPAIAQNQVRSVSQPPVMPQQPSPPVFLVRQPNPSNEMPPTQIQPTQIMTNRPPPNQGFQGN